MRAQSLPLIGGFYADETRPWSMQDICNYLPVATEDPGTRTQTMAKTPPGLSPFVNTGVTDPVRGIYNAEGRLFTVAGNSAFQISNTGVAIPLGSIPGAGRVRFAHNQITGGNEVLMVNGSAGYVWNTVTSTLTQITDSGYPGAIDAVFIDGYLIQIEPARRFAFHSDLADALSYNTLDRFTSEVSPDLLVAMAVSNNELILFSESTTEFFENTGAAQQPFRSKRISFQKGCAGRYTVATIDNSVMWLGDDGVFYRLDGYTPRRISTRPIEQMIRGLNWAQAFAFVWEDSGHSVAYWTFPDGQTIGYDASQQKWHRRASYGFNRWRVTDAAYWQGRWIAGDFQAGHLWELDWLYPYEGAVAFESTITSPVIHDNQSRVLMPRLEVIMDTGQEEVAIRDFPAQPEGPSISGTAPDGVMGEDYAAFAYTVTPGDAAIARVEIVSGALPAGLGPLSNAGVIPAGVPTALVSSAPFTVRVTDTNGLWAEVTDDIAIVTGAWIAWVNGTTTGTSGVVTSPDGTDWSASLVTQVTLGLSGLMDSMSAGIAFGGKALLLSRIVTTSGGNDSNRYLVTANKGVSFTDSNTGVTGSVGGTYHGLARGGGYVFRAALAAGFAGIWRATDAAGPWTYFPMPAFVKATSLAYKSGRLMTIATNADYPYYSDDFGTTWTKGTEDAFGGNNIEPYAICATPTRFIAAIPENAAEGIRYSTTGLGIWTAATVTMAVGDSPTNICFGQTGGANGIVVVGCSNATGKVYRSTDNGSTFTLASTTLGGMCNDIYYAAGLFVAGTANGRIMTSPDGDVWTLRKTLPNEIGAIVGGLV